MDKIKEWLKNTDRKVFNYLILAFAAGVMLLVVSKGFGPEELPPADTPSSPHSDLATATASYERQLEERLKEVLKQVEGVGEADVIITVTYRNEIDIAQDVISEVSQSEESGPDGGKTMLNESTQSKHVIITGKDGNSQPLVIRDYEPKIEGVVIIAQGGDNAYVKDALTKAAQALLGVPAHKVYILKMK